VQRRGRSDQGTNEGVVNLVRPSAAGVIDGLISVWRGWVDGRRCAVVQGVPVVLLQTWGQDAWRGRMRVL
jgi:hypothetical protein